MLTLFHAPWSRSTSIIELIHEMGIEDRIDIREVSIRRGDGSGQTDPANPHPFGKVPCLQDGSDLVYERGAVMLYLTDRFPEAGLGRPVGDPLRGRFVSWLFHYQGVIEPLMLVGPDAAKGNEQLAYTLRDLNQVLEHIDAALQPGPWLLGERYSAADLLIGGMFNFARQAGFFSPEHERVADWMKRCADRPAVVRAAAEDQKRMEAAGKA